MSEIKVNSIVDASGGNTATINGVAPNVNNIRGKNKIINGDMRVDQRDSATTAITINGSVESYATDRFFGYDNSSAVFTLEQSTDAPAGFINSLLATVTTPSGILTTTQRDYIAQKIEGSNISDLDWGTADAKTVTLSFWVKSSLTGSFSIAIQNDANNRSYASQYTINSANTWEYKTVTVTGDTAGTWNTDNTVGIEAVFSLGVGPSLSGGADTWSGSDVRNVTGSVNLVETSGATFYLTGVQLEVGDTASGFETLSYGETLAMCQRYYFRQTNTSNELAARFGNGWAVSTGAGDMGIIFPVTMRTDQYSLESSVASGNLKLSDTTTSYTVTSVSLSGSTQSPHRAMVRCDVASGLTQFRPYYVEGSTAAGEYIAIDAEL